MEKIIQYPGVESNFHDARPTGLTVKYPGLESNYNYVRKTNIHIRFQGFLVEREYGQIILSIL